MSRRVDSKSRRPNEARASTMAGHSGNRNSPQATNLTSGSGGGNDVVSGDRGASALEPALNHLHISHNYMSPYQKPQWYEPTVYAAIHKVHLVERLMVFDEQLQSLMQSDGFLKDWQQFLSVRLAIQRQFIDLLKFEMKFCRQHNVEQHCWKILYHCVIEYMKRLAADKSKANYMFYRQKCLDIIDDGVEYFERLLGILSATYKYDMNDFIGGNGGASLKGLKYISLAIVSTQKICIYLGDLLRYREIVCEGKNFVAVKKWYVCANQLIPSNGMPYNQLAVLSLYNKRKFDAVYYHLRSLHASNPIKSAKESLVVLFDEIRKKYEANRKLNPKETKEPKRRRRSENFRREIWIHPMDGQLNYRTVCLDDNEDETEVLDSADLYKRFITNYLHLQGMFFTKIGTEYLEICIEEVLRDFGELLSHQSSGIMTQQKLAHLIVLNVFAIDCHSGNDDSGALTNLQMNALAFGMCFFGLLVEKLLKEFNEIISANLLHLKTNNTHILVADIRSKLEQKDDDDSSKIIDINDFLLSDFVNNLLAAVLLWCNWMRCNYTVWNSSHIAPTIKQLTEKYGACPWDEFATVITAFGKYCFDENLLLTQPWPKNENGPNITNLRLPEDLLVLGLPHLLQMKTFYCRDEYNKTNMYTVVRMKEIWLFGSQFLCSCDPPLLQRTDSVETFSANFTACTDNRGDNDGAGVDKMARAAGVNCCDDKSTDGYASSNSESGILNATMGDDRCGIDWNSMADYTPNENAENLDSASEIQQLLQRKNELERNHKLHEKQNRYTQEILRQSKNDTLLIEIRPKYLIPDTNCFIDFLPHLQALAQSHPMYQLVLPLVVVNELEGLAKGEKSVDESPTKVALAQIQTRKSIASQAALAFLQTVNRTIRCATTKGSILNSMAFTKESDNSDTKRNLPMTEHLNNDDKILLTAVNLSQLQSNNVDRNLTNINQPSGSTNKLAASTTAAANAIGSKSTMQRRVVLLTNDRNLKVKAIAQNIPVREVSDFVKWSGITH